MSTVQKKSAPIGGSLVFWTQYGGRAEFGWQLDCSGDKVAVKCTTWEGLYAEQHRPNERPRFTPNAARQIAEKLARQIIENLDLVVRNRQRDDISLASIDQGAQLPLYRQWAWEEAKRRMMAVDLLAQSYKDDDEDDESPENVLSEKHIALAEAEYAENNEVELIEER